MSRWYWLTYSIKTKAFVRKEEVPEGHGAADCLVIGSVLGRPLSGGPLSVQFAGVDGATGEGLNAQQMFQVWTIFGSSLGKALEGTEMGDICEEVVERVRSMKRHVQ